MPASCATCAAPLRPLPVSLRLPAPLACLPLSVPWGVRVSTWGGPLPLRRSGWRWRYLVRSAFPMAYARNASPLVSVKAWPLGARCQRLAPVVMLDCSSSTTTRPNHDDLRRTLPVACHGPACCAEASLSSGMLRRSPGRLPHGRGPQTRNPPSGKAGGLAMVAAIDNARSESGPESGVKSGEPACLGNVVSRDIGQNPITGYRSGAMG